MHRTPNSKEILTYFSQFLTQIGIVMASIKKHMYDLIEVPMMNPKISSVFNSMSSIIFSTHRTYSDLKKIQSVMAGYTKSRIESKKQWSLNSTTTTIQKRSKSEESHFRDYPVKTMLSTPTSLQASRFSNFNIKSRTRCHQKTENVFDQQLNFESQSQYSFNKKDAHKFLHNSMIKQPIIDKVQGKQNISCGQLDSIESRIKNMISKNRNMFNLINLRNRECLQIISSVKQQLCLNV